MQNRPELTTRVWADHLVACRSTLRGAPEAGSFTRDVESSVAVEAVAGQLRMADIALLTLANHAEVQNGLLYVSGAEWDTVTRTYPSGGPAKPYHLAIARSLSVVVPWLEANTPLAVTIRMEDEDGRTKLPEARLDLEAGRPPGKPHGSDSRSAIAFTGEVQFPKAGGYRVVASIGDGVTKT